MGLEMYVEGCVVEWCDVGSVSLCLGCCLGRSGVRYGATNGCEWSMCFLVCRFSPDSPIGFCRFGSSIHLGRVSVRRGAADCIWCAWAPRASEGFMIGSDVCRA